MVTDGDKREPWIVATKNDVARFFSVGYEVVNNWRRDGLPGRKGWWDLKEIVAWRFSRLFYEEPDLGHGTSPALEKYRTERARMVELQRHELEGQLLPRESVHKGLAQLAMIIRGCGEQLQREFGSGAVDILDEALDDFTQQINELFPDDDDG